MGLKESVAGVSPGVYTLVILFGMSSWIDINGVFVELPLMVPVLPEGWALPSYIVLIIQIANIGPLLYTIGHKLAPDTIKEWPVVYIIISIGATACLLLVFFWDYTSYIGGEEHSTALLTLTGFLALVDCTSSVVYLPYMAYFKDQYLSAFYIGEGFSGLVPGFLGLAQGVGGDPVCVNTSMDDNGTDWALVPEYPPARFSVEVFYFCLFLIICTSGVAFTFLHFSPYCQQEKLSHNYDCGNKVGAINEGFAEDGSKGMVAGIQMQTKSDSQTEIMNQNSYDSESNGNDSNIVIKTPEEKESYKKLTLFQLILLLTYLGFVNCMTNGILPSTLSYSCLPYGNQAYGLASRLSTIANPLACFVALFIPRVSVATISVLVAIGAFMSGYQLYLAGMSPYPPWQDDVTGVVLVVLSYVILIAVFSYVKVAVATCCRDDGGRMLLLWCGGVTQIGSFVGAVISFVCVNVLELLEAAPTCPE